VFLKKISKTNNLFYINDSPCLPHLTSRSETPRVLLFICSTFSFCFVLFCFVLFCFLLLSDFHFHWKTQSRFEELARPKDPTMEEVGVNTGKWGHSGNSGGLANEGKFKPETKIVEKKKREFLFPLPSSLFPLSLLIPTLHSSPAKEEYHRPSITYICSIQ
jgi:hypothetical protein